MIWSTVRNARPSISNLIFFGTVLPEQPDTADDLYAHARSRPFVGSLGQSGLQTAAWSWITKDRVVARMKPANPPVRTK
jgi:hypothetical protein